MKCFLACVFLCAAFLSDAANARDDSSSVHVVFRIVSTRPGAEVPFRAALMFSGRDTALACREAQTPAEFSGAGDIAIGMFEKIRGEADLRVVLLDRRRSGDRVLAEAVGKVVLIDKRYGEHTAVSL